MRVGLQALGIGTGADARVVRAVARSAEAHGFATLWAGEHVVLVDEPASRYPYAQDGRIAVPADVDWFDPLIALGFAAAVTDRIGLATGVLLLPEHNPVVVAKQAATLDVLSAGRLTLGVGVGWSADEFAALGVPFEGRGRRTEEYIAAMRTLWCEDRATFAGERVEFRAACVNPKPAFGRSLPVVMGGNGDTALRRAAAICDGWYGFNLSVSEAVERASRLAEYRTAQRDRPVETFTVAVALTDGGPESLPELALAGVTEVVVVGVPPAAPDEAGRWVADLARHWLTPLIDGDAPPHPDRR